MTESDPFNRDQDANPVSSDEQMPTDEPDLPRNVDPAAVAEARAKAETRARIMAQAAALEEAKARAAEQVRATRAAADNLRAQTNPEAARQASNQPTPSTSDKTVDMTNDIARGQVQPPQVNTPENNPPQQDPSQINPPEFQPPQNATPQNTIRVPEATSTPDNPPEFHPPQIDPPEKVASAPEDTPPQVDPSEFQPPQIDRPENDDDDASVAGSTGIDSSTVEPQQAVVVADYQPKRSDQLVPGDHNLPGKPDAGLTSITFSTRLRPTKQKTLRAGVKLIGWAILAALVGLGWWFGSPEKQAEVAIAATSVPPKPPVVDDFERARPVTLDGISGDGLQWLRLGDAFTAVDGVATVDDGEEVTSIAILGNSASADGRFESEMAWAPTGTGIVYRFVDVFNYWSLVSVPDFGTWNLILTVEGEAIRSWPTGLSSLEPGTRIAVDTEGADHRVFVNGELKLTVLDDTFSEATGAGIVSRSGSQGALSNFMATPYQEP